MKRGDLVVFQDQRWIVSQYSPRRTRTATLLNADGRQVEIPHDHDLTSEVQVLANPSEQWSFLILPERPGYRVQHINHKGRILTPFLDWMLSDPQHPGGSIFLAPSLNLRYGDMLLVHYTGIKRRVSTVQRVDIPRDFGTVQQRVQRAEAAKPKLEEKRNAFSRLLADSQIGDDDD